MRKYCTLALGAALAALGHTAAWAAAAQNPFSAFNPGIGLVLQGTWASYPNDGPRTIPGFLLGPDAGLAPQGFGLGESELDIDSNIDNLFYGFAALSFHDDHGQGSAEVELAYLETLTLPAGFTVKAGKFFSDFGYQNSRHSHVWDFVDQPLVYETMLNNQYSDPGIQVRWLAPAPFYLLFGAEAFSGDRFPAGGAAHSGNGANTVYVKTSEDVGDSSTWFAGLSYMTARSASRPSYDGLGDTIAPYFTGTSHIAGADFVWKWSPHGNFYQKNFIFQAEYLQRRESGTVAVTPCPPETACAGGSAYRGSAEGWYVSGVYQWMPRWRWGLRYDRMRSDNTVSGAYQPAVLLADGFAPHRLSVMVDFSNTEFSRIRLQVNRDLSNPLAQNEVFLQYIVAMGAHPAHTF